MPNMDHLCSAAANDFRARLLDPEELQFPRQWMRAFQLLLHDAPTGFPHQYKGKLKLLLVQMPKAERMAYAAKFALCVRARIVQAMHDGYTPVPRFSADWVIFWANEARKRFNMSWHAVALDADSDFWTGTRYATIQADKILRNGLGFYAGRAVGEVSHVSGPYPKPAAPPGPPPPPPKPMRRGPTYVRRAGLLGGLRGAWTRWRQER